MLAQTRQIHHEGVFELAVNICLHLVEVGVFAPLGELGAKNLFPVRAPFDLFHTLTGNQRARTRHRLVLADLGGMQVLVVESERLIVVIHLGQVGVGENVRQHPPFATNTRFNPTVVTAHPAALPLGLVLPLFGIADTGLGLDIVEPGVLHTFATGPDIFAGHRTGVATNTLIKIENHAYLGTNFHFTAS